MGNKEEQFSCPRSSKSFKRVYNRTYTRKQRRSRAGSTQLGGSAHLPPLTTHHLSIPTPPTRHPTCGHASHLRLKAQTSSRHGCLDPPPPPREPQRSFTHSLVPTARDHCVGDTVQGLSQVLVLVGLGPLAPGQVLAVDEALDLLLDEPHLRLEHLGQLLHDLHHQLHTADPELSTHTECNGRITLGGNAATEDATADPSWEGKRPGPRHEHVFGRPVT